MTTMDGLCIKSEFLNKSQCKQYVWNSKLRRPIKQMPNIATFHIWKTTIQKITNCTNNGTLTVPLGKWIKNPADCIKITSAISPCHHWLYMQNELGTWFRHNKMFQVRGKQYFTSQGAETDFNPTLNRVPVDVQYTNKEIYVHLRKMTKWENKPVRIPITNDTFIKKLNNRTS
jgi:hypothetical protein